MAGSLQRIQSAMVDGRSRTPRYIQTQLTVLHDALTRSAPTIHRAIVQDTGCSPSEAWTEIYMALRALKQEYNSINFKDVLEEEYSIANGKDNLSRRNAVGCVYIIPAQYSRFYSIVQPLSAAIAAGNCVVVEIRKTLLETEKLLRETLTATLDRDTFAIVDQRPKQDEFFTEQVVVSDASSERESNSFGLSKQISSRTSRTVAVVDRSANISQAAKDIVRARFRFGGKSPYAPDVVFVNEFALREFTQAAVRFLTEEVSDIVAPRTKSRPQKVADSVDKDARNANTTVIVAGARGRVELVNRRDKTIMSGKTREPALLIVPTTSLDDAVDASNDNSTAPLLAAYLFADPKAAKYLSQFISADATFTNQIPSQLLVGPPAPQGHPISLAARYTKEMFSSPCPEFFKTVADEQQVTEFLEGRASKQAVEKLKQEMSLPLPDMKQPEGKAIPFFEQGLFTGLAIEGTILIGALAIGARYAVPAILGRFRA